MSLQLKIRKPAQLDLIEHYDFIAMDRPEAAERFVKNFKDTLNSVLSMPEIGRVCEFKKGKYRFISVKGFQKILIFYQFFPKKISVVRVLHASRDIKKILGL